MTEQASAPAEVQGEDTAAVLAAASGDKTYVSQPKPEETPADDAGAETKPEAEAKPEGEKPEDKARKPTVQERIDELTRARRDAERERDHFRAIAEAKPAEPAKAATEDDPEPDPASFTYGDLDPAYVKALAAHGARQEFARLTREAAERAQDREQTVRAEAVEQSWRERQADFAKDKPDYDALVNSKDLKITPVMAAAIKTGEDGAAVAYHLAQNPDEARRIAALPDIAQIRELTKIELNLSAPKAPQAKTATDAPEPAPTLRGNGGRFQVAADTDDFSAFERQYLGGT